MKETLIAILKSMIDEADYKKLEGDFNIIQDLGFDSLKVINFILAIEEKLDIEIDFEEFEFEYLESFNKLVGYLESIT